MQAKTHILKFPTEEQIPSYLHNHFIRGYFDGDGCICVKKVNTKHTASFSLEGNEMFITHVQEMLVKNCNLNMNKMYYRHPEKKTSISLRYFGRKQVKLICTYLYKNSSIYLERKFQKFQLINY
jgi:intein-encoded DNA endonuclease-like protein